MVLRFFTNGEIKEDMDRTSITAEMFANVVGRSNLAAQVGVGLPAVSNAIDRGVFPASWHEAGKRLANGKIECPPELFGQKFGHNYTSQHVNPSKGKQGRVRNTANFTPSDASKNAAPILAEGEGE